MSVTIQREYRLKFYLNAKHYVVFNGKRGEVHPHTWEFCLNILVMFNSFTPFTDYEKVINDYLAPFQNKVLNDVPEFAEKQPSLENIVEAFAVEFDRLILEQNGMLLSVEGSEGPTRSYIVRISDADAPAIMVRKLGTQVIDAVIDEALR